MAETRKARTATLYSGPWKGVRSTPEPFDDGASDTLNQAFNVYFPDPMQGSGMYARPGWVRPQSVSSANNGQGVYSHIGSDGTTYNFFVVNGALYRWSTDLSSSPVDVTPTGATIAPTGRVYFASLGDSLIVNDGQNIPWIGTNLSSTPITGTPIDLEAAEVNLLRGTTDTRVGVVAFDYLLAGTYYNHAALLSGYTLPAGTIPIDQWGVYRVSIQTSGTVTVTAGAANYTTGYASEALAIAALPAVPSGEWNVGYFTVQTEVGSTFVAGTDALQGGASGNPANATNYYAGAAPPWTAYGQPVIYYGAVFFILTRYSAQSGAAGQTTLAWSEPNLPAEGYYQTDYDNLWELTQTGSEPIYALAATNDALYYFRAYSIGAVAGAPGVNFSGTATHDIVSGNVGCTAPATVASFLNYVYFVDAVGRPYRFAVGGAPEPIWLQARAVYEGVTSSTATTVQSLAFGMVERNLNLYLVSAITSSASTNTAQWLVFDLVTGRYFGVWSITGAQVTAGGILRDATGGVTLVVQQVSTGSLVYLWRLTRTFENTWQDNAATVSTVQGQTSFLTYSGQDTARCTEVRVTQQYAAGPLPALSMNVTTSAQVSATQTRTPNGTASPQAGLVANTTRVVFPTDCPVGRGVAVNVFPTTTTTQWKCWRIEADVVDNGLATVEDN